MNRIKQINSLIDNCQCVWDVGSDHALLAIYLLREKKARLVVNIEKNLLPLTAGKNNLAKNHLMSKTLNVLNDGLKDITKKVIDKPDCIIMAGMGAKTIIEILETRDKKLEKTMYVLEANTDVDLLRKWLAKNAWDVEKELVCVDRGKFYQIMVVTPGKTVRKLNSFEAYFGYVRTQEEPKMWNKFVKFTKKKIEAKKLDKFNSNYKQIYKYIKKREKQWK